MSTGQRLWNVSPKKVPVGAGGQNTIVVVGAEIVPQWTQYNESSGFQIQNTVNGTDQWAYLVNNSALILDSKSTVWEWVSPTPGPPGPGPNAIRAKGTTLYWSLSDQAPGTVVTIVDAPMWPKGMDGTVGLWLFA